MKRLSIILIFISLLDSHGQTTGTSGIVLGLNSVSLLDLEGSGGKNLRMEFERSPEAGSPLIAPGSNSTLWVNLTSAVQTAQTRRVTALISGTFPPGFSLLLETSASTTGAGARGTPVSSLVLSSSAQTIINGIGGGYTGTGVGYGFNLKYTLQYTDYGAIREGTTVVSVVYTLTDN